MSECFRHNPLHAVPVVDLFLHGVIDKLLCLLVVKNHVLTIPVVLLGSLLVRNIVAEPFQKVVPEPTTASGDFSAEQYSGFIIAVPFRQSSCEIVNHLVHDSIANIIFVLTPEGEFQV